MSELPAAVQRGLTAVKVMKRAVIAEHKRRGLPLRTWKHGRVVSIKRFPMLSKNVD